MVHLATSWALSPSMAATLPTTSTSPRDGRNFIVTLGGASEAYAVSSTRSITIIGTGDNVGITIDAGAADVGVPVIVDCRRQYGHWQQPHADPTG